MKITSSQSLRGWGQFCNQFTMHSRTQKKVTKHERSRGHEPGQVRVTSASKSCIGSKKPCLRLDDEEEGRSRNGKLWSGVRRGGPNIPSTPDSRIYVTKKTSSLIQTHNCTELRLLSAFKIKFSFLNCLTHNILGKYQHKNQRAKTPQICGFFFNRKRNHFTLQHEIIRVALTPKYVL